MDGSKFDSLTKGLATGRSRRSVLKGLVGGGAALLVSGAGSTLAKPSPEKKVTVCHHAGDSGKSVEISISTNALAAHLQQHPDDYSGPCAVCIPIECAADACGELYDSCGNYVGYCSGGCCYPVECKPDACEPQFDTCGNYIGDCTGGCSCVPIDCAPEECGPQFDTCGEPIGDCTGGCECHLVECAPDACGERLDSCGNQVGFYCYNGCTCTPILEACTPGVSICCGFDNGGPCSNTYDDCQTNSNGYCC